MVDNDKKNMDYLMKLTDAWNTSITELIENLDDDAVEVATLFPFENIKQVQNYGLNDPGLNRSICGACGRALTGANSDLQSHLVKSLLARLSRDENALNWVFHVEIRNCNVAGNDENVIDLVKSMPSTFKLAITVALSGLREMGKAGKDYLAHIDAAMNYLIDFCSQPDAANFRILPTDPILLGTPFSVRGNPGNNAISHNASTISTLPKTILIKLAEHEEFFSALQSQTIASARRFPMAARLQATILSELAMEFDLDIRKSIERQLFRNYRFSLTYDDLVQTPGPVVGGFLRLDRANFARFQVISRPGLGWPDENDRLALMYLVGHLYAMANLNQLGVAGMDSHDVALSHFCSELSKTPGIPALNNFEARFFSPIDIPMIDRHLDEYSETMIPACAYQFFGEELSHNESHSFLLRLARNSSSIPSNILYEYGLTRLALEAQKYLKEHLSVSGEDLNFDYFCYKIGLDALPCEEHYQISRKKEVFNLLPSHLRTIENRVFLGLDLDHDELENASEAVRERAFVRDLGL